METKSAYAVPGLVKAYQIIDFIAEHETATFNELLQCLDIPKSTLFVTLNTLLQGGYLQNTPKIGYRLGLKLAWLGNKVMSALEADICPHAEPVMKLLVREITQKSYLGVYSGKEAIYLAKAEPQDNRWEGLYEKGMAVPYQTSAIGKALLAWRDEGAVREIISRYTPTKYTSRAILDPDEFVRHLKSMSRHGFVLNNRENIQEDVCIAAPVYSRKENGPIGGLSVATPFDQITPELFHYASEKVYYAARLISTRLGAADYPEFKHMPYPAV